MNLIFYHPPSSTKRALISILNSNVYFFRVEDKEFPTKGNGLFRCFFFNERCSSVKNHRVTTTRPKNYPLESNKRTLGKIPIEIWRYNIRNYKFYYEQRPENCFGSYMPLRSKSMDRLGWKKMWILSQGGLSQEQRALFHINIFKGLRVRPNFNW